MQQPVGIGSRAKRAWNAFFNRDPTRSLEYYEDGPGFSYRPDRVRLRIGNERSIIASIYNRIAIDVAQTTINHVRLDADGRLKETIDSGLNRCLTIEANADQTGKAFLQDVAMSLFDEGCIALVPVETDRNPTTGTFDILSIRTAKIIEWRPQSVRVQLYNEFEGKRDELVLPKRSVAILENPLYAVMNEPNSTLRRLIQKLNLLDAVDEQSSSGKLDLIIQLPYVVRSDAKKAQAAERKKLLENQLAGSKYGVAYTDATEKITQLNRSVENNLMGQIEYLTSMLYSQLGMTQEIFDGTADDKVLTNYYTRTVEPIVAAISDEMLRKFLSPTARTQGQAIRYFRDPFKFVPVSQVSEIADKFTRNEIMSSNEIRNVIGLKPSSDPSAEELRNKNLSSAKTEMPSMLEKVQTEEGDQNGRTV